MILFLTTHDLCPIPPTPLVYSVVVHIQQKMHNQMWVDPWQNVLNGPIVNCCIMNMIDSKMLWHYSVEGGTYYYVAAQ